MNNKIHFIKTLNKVTIKQSNKKSFYNINYVHNNIKSITPKGLVLIARHV